VTSVSRKQYPELEVLGAESLAVELNDSKGMRKALGGVDCVFHVAAKTGVWGPREEYWLTNVEGTRNVLAQSLARGVKRLVYTSSPSVVFDGRDHVRASNDLPYPARFLAPYPETKSIAEREVLAANGRSSLATCALRPHLIFGPRDPHLIPRVIERARAGKLAIVGDGSNEVTMCYVDNAAHAHLLAARNLEANSPQAGRAWFVGQEQPVLLWTWINELLAALEIPAVTRRVSRRSAALAGGACELAWRALRKQSEPPMTRFVAAQLASSHSYDMAPAREAFGYEEIVDMPDATARLVSWLRVDVRPARGSENPATGAPDRGIG
jgi:nucleoside-diphosphate-sugar epimerase